MDKLRILVVEDERLVASIIASNCERLGYEVAAILNSGEEFHTKVAFYEPDILIMDINLGKTSGLTLYQSITHLQIPVIFTTAYSDSVHVDKALSLNPAGYIVKPVTLGQLKVQLAEATKRVIYQKTYELEVEGKLRKVFYRDILYFEAAKNYVNVRLFSGEIMKKRDTLTGIEKELLGNDFVQIHRSYIVNRNHIAYIQTTKCQLTGEVEIPIGRSYRDCI